LAADVWSTQLPKIYRPVVTAGRVSLQFTDETANIYGYRAWTDFNIQISFRYRTQPKKERRATVARVTWNEPEVLTTHEMRLPSYYQNRLPEPDGLVVHELDHVAISSHPRIRRLISVLHRDLTEFRFDGAPAEPVLAGLVKAAIQEASTARREALDRLIRYNQQQLDRVTDHGGQAWPGRGEFFRSLYTAENLQAGKFEFADLDCVQTLVADPEYLKLDWPAYAFDDVAEPADDPGK
jgi:hypothetical protein